MKPAPWGDPWDRRSLLGHLLAHHQGHPAADLLDLVSLLALFLMVMGAVISVLALMGVEFEHLI